MTSGRSPANGTHSTGNVLSERPLTVEDLAGPMAARVDAVQVIRDRHHSVARLLATGIPYGTIASNLGMSTASVRILARDPSVMELVAEYHVEFVGEIKPLADETIRLLGGIRIKGLRMAHEILEEAEAKGEHLPIQRLVSLIELSTDRTGYAKRTEVVHRDGDLAEKLARARQRSAKVIELRPVASEGAIGLASLPAPTADPLQPTQAVWTGDTQRSSEGESMSGGERVALADIEVRPVVGCQARADFGESILGSVQGKLRPLPVEVSEGVGSSALPPPTQSLRRRRA